MLRRDGAPGDAIHGRDRRPVTPEGATDGPAAIAKAMEEVTKGVLRPMVNEINEALKDANFGGDASSFATGTPDERLAKLRRAVGPRTAGKIDDVIARGAMTALFGAGVPDWFAPQAAKRIALDTATHAAKQVRQAPEGVLKSIHQRGPTV